ncbi:hypothetical protein K458DRAFT_417060 [Lentithecium fluviatile CBS 122367]|uniref:Uncharacterized protein n=1 Tax=Lentithecium fluviatile CBS 122367 TaxID=1168545 RepID=A0A6G1J5P5_9PLEO|nr:hypothetical protein K458DRAFT_417060 [Lentithecium fluviatile CBS 122367]
MQLTIHHHSPHRHPCPMLRTITAPSSLTLSLPAQRHSASTPNSLHSAHPPHPQILTFSTLFLVSSSQALP